MTTIQHVELGVLGPLQVRQYGLPVSIPGAKPRAILTMLGLHGGSVVSADTLLELLWGDDPPRTAAKALQTHISALRRALGDGFVLTEGTGWTLATTEIDASRYKSAAKQGRDAMATGDVGQAVASFDEALTLWRGIPELPESSRGVSEKTRWIEVHAAVVEDRADALLATGRAAEIIGELEAAIADAPLRERRWGHLILALYRAGRQGEALGAYQRARSLLANELGVDPGPDLRRLEAAIVAQDDALEMPVSQHLSVVTRAVTFLLTDIEGSTAAWEADADAMAAALARHDEIVEQVVTSRGGRLIKTRGEGDATFSVFDRPSAAAAAAIDLQEAISHEPWALADPMRIRVALHTGEVELRDGDYFGRAVNRAARLRSLAAGGQILCSGATAELVVDSLSDDVLLIDLGTRQLKNLARPEHVFELRLETADDSVAPTTDVPIERPGLPTVLVGPGPFVGRGHELARLLTAWQTTLNAGTHAVLIAGEPGVGKTRLAGEWSRQAYEQGAVVIYGRCDEDLGAPYQPFAEALRSLVPCLGTDRLRGLRGVEALLPLVPGLTDVLPDLAAPARADADTERYALFDAVVALLGVASKSAPVVLILDDLHWAAKSTLLLLRHLLRFGEHARVQIVGTYRSTDLDRSHPLAAMLADLHRDGSAHRLALSGLDEDDVTAYVAEAGYDDEELARALATVTGGNPFFLIEALRHVDESGGRWDPSTLPQGVREAVSRRLSRLPAETNKALAAAAVVGSRFALDLVERVVDGDLIDAFDEACKAGIVIEEPGGRYRFNHALVRQSLLAELASVRRMRLHQRIATTLETEPGAGDELLAELAYHYFECAWAGNAGKAVEYCRRAADQAMARLAYEGAADLYDKALHALDELDEELPDRDDQQAELLVARCEALLAAGDVVTAAGAVSQLQGAAGDSARLAAWGTCFDGQLSMLTDPERLDDIESALGDAAEKLAGLDDAAGEAKAHTVRAGCLARLGRIGDAETALDQALTAARRAREHRRVNAVLANAPLAALWGPNPVPRAGGRCLDVVRLLRITTGSPVVEATSTRCQGVLDAFRGRAAAGRALIDSARRTLSELGMRHALLEVDQFAGIVELVADDPASAEPHLRRAYNGFRRMGLDADTAETAALLARTCLALDKDAEANELCSESERLAGHALKPSIAWRTVRAELLARSGAHDEARRVAEDAVAVAGRTDLLVDHGDACLALATVLQAAGEVAGARAAADQAVGLYELKGAAALAEKARSLLDRRDVPAAATPPEAPIVELDNACVRVMVQIEAAFYRKDWDEYEALYAPDVFVESRRKIVGFTQGDLPSGDWPSEARRLTEMSGGVRQEVVAARGERLALARLEIGTEDMSPGAPHDEFLQLYGIDEECRVALQVFFDLEDMDAAIAELDAAHARFEERHPRTRFENTARRVEDQCYALIADGRLDEFGALLAEKHLNEDRRQGLRRETIDRATAIENIRAIAALGVNITITPLALRGDRLCLSQLLYEQREAQPDAFSVETLELTEVDTNGVMAARVVFDPDEIDAAFAELDARYLAGEAAAHAHTWSVVARTYAEFNRHDYDPSSVVNIDNRRVARFAPGDLTAANTKDVAPNLRAYIEAVHRLGDLGVVVTTKSYGTSPEGFDAEWRVVSLQIVNGDLMSRNEMFDEADLDAALARFDELSRPAPRLENAASRVYERLNAYFSTGDWAAMSKAMAQNMVDDDRRRTVNAAVRHGRDIQIANGQAVAETGTDKMTSTVIATRGGRLALCRTSIFGTDQQPGAFRIEFLSVIEIDSDEQLVAHIAFDLDQVDAAFDELDARYLVGEAAPYAQTWQIVVETVRELNRHETGPTLGRLAISDHRRLPFAPGDFGQALEDLWTLVPDARYTVSAVHRLQAQGAVICLVIVGTDTHGNELQWVRIISCVTEQWRAEVYEEDDLDVAIARFEQLSPLAPRLENAASRAVERYLAHFAAREWGALATIVADNISNDDRRPVVNAGIRHGRDNEIASLRASAGAGFTHMTSVVTAVRGERLVLTRVSGHDKSSEGFINPTLGVVEINSDNLIAAIVVFDPDDIDAAFEELDARYLAGEAAAYADTWSVVAEAYASFNRRETPATTPDWVNVDHRRGAAFAPGDMIAYIQAAWDDSPDTKIYIAAMHRLSNLGAVVTHVAHGISQEGFDAEWRDIHVLTVDGDMLSRSELFDDADLDAALACFDELSRPVPRLENAASQVYERFWSYYDARDWIALTELVVDDLSTDDRRRVVNAGVQHGRDVEFANIRGLAEIGLSATDTVLATRGQRLVLTRCSTKTDEGHGEFTAEMLCLIEIDSEDHIAAGVIFDLDDIDAAFAELDTRYLAGEASAHAHTWSVIADTYGAFNQRELDTTSWVNVDHRRVTRFAPGDLTAVIRAATDLTPDLRIHIEAVHRLGNCGAVITNASFGTSQHGFGAEWRMVQLLTVEGDRINRLEIFDEADLDAALARFEELQPSAPRLENAASQVYKRFWTCFAARDWVAMAEVLAADTTFDDRRRVVNAGIHRGRDAAIADMRAVAELWAENMTTTVGATRGSRLALSRVRSSATESELLNIVEIDADNRIVALVAFDPDDIDAAFEELDARYLAGEAAAAHARTWSLVSEMFAALNRREIPATTPDFVNVDHRRVARVAPGDLIEYTRASWNQIPDITFRIEAVHRLTDLGALVTQVERGTSQEGFEADWREIHLMTHKGDQFNRSELFDEADLDAALARFDELSHPAPKLENTASRVVERYLSQFAPREWKAMAEMVAEDFSGDDRRRVVNSGVRTGRDAEMANVRAIDEIGCTDITATPLATRGERLVLTRHTFTLRDWPEERFDNEFIDVIEIDADNRIAAQVSFDPDDIEAAFEELDARYLAGEAAAHSHTWSVIAEIYAGLNRHELPATTPDWVNVDHRKVTSMARGDHMANLRASWDLTPQASIYIEAVHRLNDLGAVVTHSLSGTTQEGFFAEWRMVDLMTFENDLMNRSELFDESDLDAALARFDELTRPAPQLENAASQVYERFLACFGASDWDAVSEMLAEDIFNDDRRRVVSAGVRQGRDATIASMRAIADLGRFVNSSTVLATRGRRLVLSRERFSVQGEEPDAILAELLGIVEIDVQGRIAARVVFDPDDIDAAFEELESRYLAGEAADHAPAWSAVTGAYATLNRHEIYATTADFVDIDHRRGAAAFAPGDLIAYMRAAHDQIPDVSYRLEAVHRLSGLGAVYTQVLSGTSTEGFAAEWRLVQIMMVKGDLMSRAELFDEADLDAALARFDELSRPAPRLENAASRAYERVQTYFSARDFDGMTTTMATDIYRDDRRRIVNAEENRSLEATIAEARVAADLGAKLAALTVVAIRGQRLTLVRSRHSGRDTRPEAFNTEALVVVEIDRDERIAAHIMFDFDNFDAAFAELDARYLAGEAAAHAHTWSVIAQAYAGSNRHELPKVAPDWVNVDHRRAIAFAPGELTAYTHATWDQAPDLRIYIEAVHRLNSLGAVVTQVGHGTAHEGFEAEWREIVLVTVEADLIDRIELFDQGDIDAALARFDELSRPAPQLENAASQVAERVWMYFAARDWDAVTEMLADDTSNEDRRPMVGSGFRRGRDAQIADMRAIVDIGITTVTSAIIATRGRSLVLRRTRFLGQDRQTEAALLNEILDVVEIDDDERIAAVVMFGPDDTDAAFAELDARYLAGEAAAHAHTWSLIAEAHAAFNRHELPAKAPDVVDRRPLVTLEAGDPTAKTAMLRDMWDLMPDLKIYIEAVHRLTDLGAVFTQVSHGTSQAGFDAEWRVIQIMTVDGAVVSRVEMFDEADIDAALARFDELSRPARQLENAACRAEERFWTYFAARDWAATAEIVADDIRTDDRRRIVNAGLRQGRDALIAEVSALAEVGVKNVTSDVIATRGEHLVLSRVRLSDRRDQESETFLAVVLAVVEIDTRGRFVARVVFDLDDIDAAFAELDARYLAGEAADHSHIWSVIARTCAVVNRRELPATTPDWVNIDHRRGRAFVPGELIASVRSGWDLIPDISVYIEAVHRLSNLGAIVTRVMNGTSQAGFDAEWRVIDLVTVEGDLISRYEIFDETDIDAAIARFDELQPQMPRLENAASRADDRVVKLFETRDWDAIAETLAFDISVDDRRRVVNAGNRRGRDLEIANLTALAEVGVTKITSTVIATREQRLALVRSHVTDRWSASDESAVLYIVEVNADNRIGARVVFDLADIDAAFEELDARYLTGEAAAHARTWSVVQRACAALNKHEIPATTPDWVNVDHRRITPIGTGDLTAAFRVAFEVVPDMTVHIVAVHRLSDLGAVITHAAEGTSQEGFAAEWRSSELLTVQGDLINRAELFDEADIDAALARFDELSRPAPRLENAASQVYERFGAYFAARDWDAISQLLAADYFKDDRRGVVNAGVRHGRDMTIVDLQAIADIGATSITSVAVATRGTRIALCHTRAAASGPEAFYVEALQIVEITTDQRIVAVIDFDLDDIDAAFEELDARYLAGEAAAHAHAWSLIKGTYAALNRRELPATTPDWVTVDHRRVTTFAPGDLTAYLGATWDVVPTATWYVEAVHRLSNLGAVVTHMATGTSQEGFDAEWREIAVVTVDGNLFNRCEMFDEADLDAALARFDEVNRPAPQLENAASRAEDRFFAYFRAGNWAAIAEILNDGSFIDDQRRGGVSVGRWDGRDVVIANLRALAEAAANTTLSVMATRGERLTLTRMRSPNRDPRQGEFDSEMIIIAEIDADERIVAQVVFDLDDIDSAFEELESRYLAGEAAARSHTWSAIAEAYAAFNRRELPATTSDWTIIDRQRGQAFTFAPGEMIANIRASWDQMPGGNAYIEAVHRLSSLGAVVIHSANGTSQEGFEVEWRSINIVSVDGDLLSRVELFDEADLDAALARFDELNRPAPQLENAAIRVHKLFQEYFAARDWAAMNQTLADEHYSDDRRRVVNSGTLQGRDAEIASMQAMADLGVKNFTTVAIATRGNRLALCRIRGATSGPGTFNLEVLRIVEIDVHDRIVARIVFDLDDIEAAFAELDARYLAGEAATHAHAWSVVANAHAALNRRELPPTTRDWVNIDHRQGAAFVAGDLFAYIRTAWDLMPNVHGDIEAVHRFTNLGAVVTHAIHGKTQEGFDAEWRQINLLMVDGDLINRIEIFDETNLDAALAKFDELDRTTPQIENAASRSDDRLKACFAARDWAAVHEILSEDTCNDDRRRVVGAGILNGRQVSIADLQAIADVGTTVVTSTVIATRGERLALSRYRFSGRDPRPEAFHAEMLGIVEVNVDNRIAARVWFDIDSVDAAFEELDARYLAGEAAAHSQTWPVVTRAYAALNRCELPELTPDSVNTDHRRAIAFAPGDMGEYIRASLADAPDFRIYIAAVHRLSDVGTVVTQAATGTSQQGFDAEWRMISLITVDGERIKRTELFDETDIDAAIAKFDELNRAAPRLNNAASRAAARFQACFAARHWDAMAELLADDTSTNDRRPLVGVGVRRGRDAVVADYRATADVGVKNIAFTVIATRGDRLALFRLRFAGRDQRPEAFHTDVLGVVEIDTDERIAACVMLDLDDMDAAFAEVDKRYLAGEAADYAETWSVILRITETFNRRELPAATPNFVNIDHRRGISFAPGDLAAYVRATWDLTPQAALHIEAVHRLSSLGAVVVLAAHATSQEGFGAEWRMVELLTVDGELLSRVEVFDDADIDTAIAKFDELDLPGPRLENAASRVEEGFRACFAARDWAAMTEMVDDDFWSDDRRRVVGSGLRRSRDDLITQSHTTAELGVRNIASTLIATRGERLILSRTRFYGRDRRPAAYHTEVLGIFEIGANNRITAAIQFDPDDTDAAVTELNARYAAGEASGHSHTWSVIANVYDTFNRHEHPATTPDWVTVDHRQLATWETDDPSAAIRDIWNLTPDLTVSMEAVHRLSDVGAVVTHVAKGTSDEGFDAEWRMIFIFTVDGDMISRCEMFDEADLNAALARFDELSSQTPRLDNLASQVYKRCNAYFTARDWDALAGTMADDISTDDRRRVIGGHAQHGREAVTGDLPAIADLGMANLTWTVIATRGSRLVLARARYSGHDQGPGAFTTDILQLVEIDADEQMLASIVFDPDDMDAAIEELDARYRAGEAAPYAHAWSVIAGAYGTLNRHELPAIAPDWVNIDRRRLAMIEAGHLAAYVRANRDAMPELGIHVEAVHRLGSLGAVVTRAVNGTSEEGFYAEWREIDLLTVDGELINRCEIFDEADIDAAIAKFDELSRPAPPLENAAMRTWVRQIEALNRRDVEGFLAGITAEGRLDDRRKGLRVVMDGQERTRAFRELFIAPSSWRLEVEPIAIRGTRLSLTRERSRDTDEVDRPITVEVLTVIEVSDDGLVHDTVSFDPDDIDAAFEELDARYVAGEAAAHAHTWSVITGAYATFNRRELPPTTPDLVNFDHRRGGTAFEPGEQIRYIHATWDVAPEVKARAQIVHRLTTLGAVVTQVVNGTSQEGFDAQWREICVVTVEGDAFNRIEMFDEDDLDAALANFDELNGVAHQLQNAATRVVGFAMDAFNRRDLDSYRAVITADGRYQDQRKGLRDEGLIKPAFARTLFLEAPASWHVEVEPVAIRGPHLALCRLMFRDHSEVDRPIAVDALLHAEVTIDDLISRFVLFDPDDINGAFAELTARWIASGEVAHPEVIELARGVGEAYNRHDWDAVATREAGATYVNHRQLISGDTETIVDHGLSIRTLGSLIPDMWVEQAEVLTHSAIGLVSNLVVKGTTTEGATIELPAITLILFDGDRITRLEAFDLNQRDLALARFQELSQPALVLENAATRTRARLADAINRHDLDGFVALTTAGGRYEDRRKGFRDEGQLRNAAHALFETLPFTWHLEIEPVAVRGSRIGLTRETYRDIDEADRPITGEGLTLTEVSGDDQMCRAVLFDPDDINGAMAELTARWIVSGEVAHPEVIETECRLVETANRHDFDALAVHMADAAFVNHRQLTTGNDTIAEFILTFRTFASLVPDVWVEIAEILTHSASGLVTYCVMKGTSTEGVAFELPIVQLTVLDGERVTHLENFDPDQRDLALARFQELNTSR